MEGKPHRFFLFQSGATLGTFVEHRQEQRVVWSKSLVVEPNGQCFTSVAPTTVRTTTTDHQAESWSEDNDAATPLVARAMHPCQVHHRLSRFCSQNLLPFLRQSMTFRNTYDKQPSFVRHQLFTTMCKEGEERSRVVDHLLHPHHPSIVNDLSHVVELLRIQTLDVVLEFQHHELLKIFQLFCF